MTKQLKHENALTGENGDKVEFVVERGFDSAVARMTKHPLRSNEKKIDGSEKP